MRTFGFLLGVLAVVQSGSESTVALAQKLPPGNRTPSLVLSHPGPQAPVTALAFSPDASTLYVGGLDKMVRRYVLKAGEYVAAEPLRVPIGTGLGGAINAIAVSPDGKWVAVAGRAPVRGENWSGSDDGISINTQYLSRTMKQDFGVVYLFDTTNPQGGQVIRGPESAVQSLAFANPAPADGDKLVTTGVEWDADNRTQEGVVRVFDVKTGNQIDMRGKFPTTMTPPGLAAWATGAGKKGLRVAVSWRKPTLKNDGEALVWDAPGGDPQPLSEMAVSYPLAVRVGNDGSAKQLLTSSYDIEKRAGRLTARDTDPVGNPRFTDFPGTATRAGPLPLALVPLTVAGLGESTAVILRDTNAPAGSVEVAYELRLLGEGGKNANPVALGAMPISATPVLAASRNGRFVAVGGFADNRVEVYDTTKLAANQAAMLPILDGAKGGFARASFLAGNKLWMGGAKDTPGQGGLVLDLAKREVVPGDGKAAVDSPPPLNAKLGTGVVTGTGFKDITLRAGFLSTAVAYLPAKPAWNPDLGAHVAVAMTHPVNKQTIITLFDADGKRVLDLEGPALRVEGLAFSSSRALLVAVGADHAVSVWSLRNLKGDLPALSGVTVADKNGEVIVESIEPGSASSEKLKVGNVIQEVGTEKGPLKAVKTPMAFLLAIRAMQVGDKAQLKLKDQAAPVLVSVGVSVGHRHPLVTLWIDPIARDKVHDWVGWTQAGPYDTNSPRGEARIGWVTATGNPAQPATFEGAQQHRDDYYKMNLLRDVIDEADYDNGFEKWRKEQPAPELGLTVTLNNPVEQRDGRSITRHKSTLMHVSLADPRNLIVPQQAVLRWRILNRDDTVGEWHDAPVHTGRAEIDLSRYPWTRGRHRFQFALFRKATSPYPEIQPVAIFEYIPPAPVVTVFLDGKQMKPGEILETLNDSVSVSVSVQPGPDGPADFTLTAGGGKPVAFLDRWFGFFGSHKVALNPGAKVELMVTARTTGDSVNLREESDTVGVTVRRLRPEAPPRVSLKLTTPHNPRSNPTAPYLSDTPNVRIVATLESQAPITKVEWDQGTGVWERVKFDQKQPTVVLPEVKLNADGKPVIVHVRATNNKELAGDDGIAVLYTALPRDPGLDYPPDQVTAANLTAGGELVLTGRYETPGTVPFTLVVTMTSARGDKREVQAVINPKTLEWRAALAPWPGDNLIGLVIRNEFCEVVKPQARSVRYIRPPVLIAVPPVNAEGVAAAPVVVTGITPAGVAPSELLIDGKPVGKQLVGKTICLLGLDVWTLRAEGVPVEVAGKRLETVSVVARNADGDSKSIATKVVGKGREARPPKITLLQDENPIGPDAILTTNKPEFTFKLRVTSEKPLTRLQLWRSSDQNPKEELIEGISHTKARQVAGEYVLELPVSITLARAGNAFRVTAVNSEAPAPDSKFRVNYKQAGVGVRINSITEVVKGGKDIPLKWTNVGQAVLANGHELEVEGEVNWENDDDPVATNRNLKVVFVANHIAHTGVPVMMPATGARIRKFAGRVYLPAKQNLVRVELRSGIEHGAKPQRGSEPFSFVVECNKPLQEQRLHVLVIAVDNNIPDSAGPRLAKTVVEALRGKLDDENAKFDSGVMSFTHPRFSRAMIYPPRVGGAVDESLITGLLQDVERQIAAIRKLPNQDWINDVILVYYQGEMVVGSDGRERLHTSRSLSFNPARPEVRAREAVALDALYRTPGFRLPLLNVVDYKQAPLSPFDAELYLLRYTWKNPKDRDLLLPIIEKIVANHITVGDVINGITAEVTSTNKEQLARTPTDTIPESVRPRLLGGNK